MPATFVNLRIVILQVDTDVWCDLCAVPCAVTITYVAEESGRPPTGVRRLTYCESCEER